MKTVKVGAQISYQKWTGQTSTAAVLGIEICKQGEKYGRSVNQARLDTHLNIVLTLGNSHWCYADQIREIINPQKTQR